MFRVPEKWRVTRGRLATDSSYGNNGMFVVPWIAPRGPISLTCVASDGTYWVKGGLPPPPWEHISVSTPNRTPTWAEMCFVKDVFWDKEDVVIQIHPRQSEYVNYHPFCLHLWRPVGVEIPCPPSIAVGPR